jgi:hypothetical protein
MLRRTSADWSALTLNLLFPLPGARVYGCPRVQRARAIGVSPMRIFHLLKETRPVTAGQEMLPGFRSSGRAGSAVPSFLSIAARHSPKRQASRTWNRESDLLRTESEKSGTNHDSLR